MMYRRKSDVSGQWVRGEPVEVSQEWLNKHRVRMSPETFKIEGDEGVTVDAGNDGLPDSGWTKKDIGAWLKGKGEVVSGYTTKSKLLDMVKTTLNPPAPEPEPVVEEVPVEEAVEEQDIIGDEE
tara:strand:+ start:381 stop:752 length:372 start_codon:yes stop_codon:yes gene_type:complete